MRLELAHLVNFRDQGLQALLHLVLFLITLTRGKGPGRPISTEKAERKVRQKALLTLRKGLTSGPEATDRLLATPHWNSAAAAASFVAFAARQLSQ